MAKATGSSIAAQAVMPVHINGQQCDMDRIKAWADLYELAIIEKSSLVSVLLKSCNRDGLKECYGESLQISSTPQ